jgi:hypothetical protein
MTHLLHTPPKTQTGGRGRRHKRRPTKNAATVPATQRTQGEVGRTLRSSSTTHARKTQHRFCLPHESQAHSRLIVTDMNHKPSLPFHSYIGSFMPPTYRYANHRLIHASSHSDLHESQAHSRLIAHIQTRNISSFLPPSHIGSFMPQTHRYSNHRLIHASSHSYIHES